MGVSSGEREDETRMAVVRVQSVGVFYQIFSFFPFFPFFFPEELEGNFGFSAGEKDRELSLNFTGNKSVSVDTVEGAGFSLC